MIDPHLKEIRERRGLRGLLENRFPLGALALVPDVRARRLLRLLSESARKKTFPYQSAPIIQSFEPGEDWRYCYVDETYV